VAWAFKNAYSAVAACHHPGEGTQMRREGTSTAVAAITIFTASLVMASASIRQPPAGKSPRQSCETQRALEEAASTWPPTCPTGNGVSYVGRYCGPDNELTGYELARDAYCADQFKRTKFPAGFVTVFGSSRLPELGGGIWGNFSLRTSQRPSRTTPADFVSVRQPDEAMLYAFVRVFAYEWTTRYGTQHPIMAGGAIGLMGAAARGATDAGGPSVTYTTHYSANPSRSAWVCDAGKMPPNGQFCYLQSTELDGYMDPRKPAAPSIPVATDGLIFSSVSMRETAMIMHSAAMVFAPGGSGTEWEIWQVLEMLKSRQLSKVPVYFVGEQHHWQSFMERMLSMEMRGTIKRGEIPVVFSRCPADLVNRLSYDLKLSTTPAPDAQVACAPQLETITSYESQAVREALDQQ